MSKILVIVDVQNDFITGSLGSKDAESIVDKVVAKIESHDGPIFVTKDTHGFDYLNSPEGKILPIEHCIRDTVGWLLDEKVVRAISSRKCRVFEKSTFGSALLVQYLNEEIKRDDEVDEIEFVGLCTDICVITNVLATKTYLPTTKISVDASCCAGTTPERHTAALDIMKGCHVYVMNDIR